MDRVKRIYGSENISLAQTKHSPLKLWDGRPARPLSLLWDGRLARPVYSPSRRHTPPLSVNLMQPKGPIARKMLSKGFGK
ncbi:hypothetical protein [Microcoleus sp. Pol10D4]|uniref:hypothetical protein n=1 Tax=Microcoleus sp. Pol10D4 TaxID=3055387 RepID=UPI002FD29F6F